MKENSALEELFISYITGALSEEDKALAEQYINSDESVRKPVEELRKTWKLLNISKQLAAIDVDREWTRFEQSIPKKEQKLTVIKAPVQAGGGTRLRRIALVSAAASMLLFSVLGWMFSQQEGVTGKIASAKPVRKEIVRPVLRHEINTSTRPRMLQLQDGTQVQLSGNSEISYQVPFESGKRDITLKGTAGFQVAKDKRRPFTVYSTDLLTTALGTHFTVSAQARAASTTVRLTEGKVVVKPRLPDPAGLAHEYYIMPGQELVYDRRRKKVRIRNFTIKAAEAANALPAGPDLPEMPEARKGSWFMFNNQALDQVFDQLSALYHVNIKYDKKDIKNLYFLAGYNKTDSLETVLREITKVNNLKLTKQNEAFIIAK